jgi:hypothetical protein
VNVLTLELIESMLKERGLLSDGRLERLAVIDLGELELLEGLAEVGQSPHEVLREWTTSTLRGVPLATFVHRRYAPLVDLRPFRMKAAVDATLKALLTRLRLPKGE